MFVDQIRSSVVVLAVGISPMLGLAHAQSTPPQANSAASIKIKSKDGANDIPEKCDKQGMRIFPKGMAAMSSAETCCGSRGPKVGMSAWDVYRTCWPTPVSERSYTTVSGTTVIRRYGVHTYNGVTKELTFVNDVLVSIYEGL